MDYTPEIWEDLTWDEKQTYHIAEEFESATRDRGNVTKWLPSASAKTFYDYDRDGKYPGDKIRESKNWRYFCDVWEKFKEDANFDPHVFIEACFRRLSRDKSIVPAQLRTKANYDAYKDYRMKLKMSDRVSEEKQIMQDIVNTYKAIQRKLGKKDPLTSDDLFDFFNKPAKNSLLSDGILMSMQEMVSPFYYALSESFYYAWQGLDKDIKDEISSDDRLRNISAVVRSKTRVYQFLKKVFGADIV